MLAEGLPTASWTWYKYSTCFQNIHFYFIVKLMLSSIFSALIVVTNSMCLCFNYRDLSTASLRYLSSRQALADIVNFRTEIARKRELTKNKWVTFGGSYGGSLAVWSRIKHPNLFAAAVGSCAPVQAKLNFYEYYEVVGRIPSAHNSKCPKAVKEAFDILVQMLKLPENCNKQWFYQCWTEFGFFKTTELKNRPFSGTPLRYFLQKCSDIFVPEFNSDSVAQGVKATNKHYGDFNVNGSKIIFSNGSIDPWYTVRITKDISEDLPAVFIKGNTDMNTQRPTNRMKYTSM
ncbi:thymus-specific serine protease-like [Trichechus manatus latirostris]|uniref:Thymus-specific serine protease-like n=1 Tax=Trichechus manatus latirostris TaxID=127582 RepID=A0A2Y9R0G1_TRIMA|nr:thymus-specific serine protease-like [Trichechus manatus latirostris]